MHVTLPIKSLADAMKTVKPAVPTRSHGLPQLGCARLEAAGDTLTLITSDLDLTIRQTIPATVHMEGVALAAFAPLGHAVKGKGSIELRGDRDGESLRAVNGLTTMVPSMSIDDYPALPDLAAAEACESFLLDMSVLRSVLPAASHDDNRPILTGVLFRDGEIVATDSYRLHLVRDVPTPEEPLLIPSRALRAVSAYIRAGSVTVTPMQFGVHKSVVFSAPDGTTWVTRLVEGEFPNYKQLIPSSHPFQMSFPRPAFEETLRTIDAALGKRSPVPVRLTETDGALRVWAKQDAGPIESTMPGECPVDWAANATYLADLVHGLSTCSIHYIDALKPALISEVDGEGRTHQRIIMPVRAS